MSSPPLKIVPPEYVLLPNRVSEPVPALVSDPLPLIAAPKAASLAWLKIKLALSRTPPVSGTDVPLAISDLQSAAANDGGAAEGVVARQSRRAGRFLSIRRGR